VRPGRARVESNLLILVTLALVAFGLVMVYSATSAAAAVSNGDPAYYLKRQALYTGLGIVAMVLVSRVDFHALRRMAGGLLLTSLVLLLAVLALGRSVNGARRWIELGPLQFQPSELAKVAVAVWAAAYLARRKPPRTLKQLARPLGLLVGVVCVLVLAEPDMGTAIAIVAMVTAMLLVAGTPPRPLALGVGAFALVGLAAIWFEPYRRARVFSFVNPWHDAQGAGFQTVQAMIGLGSGGLVGRGLGQSVQKLFYLPEAHTDMIFAIIGEELGLVGSLLVIVAYVVFAFAGLRVALRCRDPFGKRLATGLTVLVCGQAAINLAAVMGLAPLTGIPLPFVSYGGSSIVVALASVGVLLNIATNDGVERRAQVLDRGRRDRRPRAAVTGGRGGLDGAGRARDLRRVAGSGRGAARP
jgi:cell division protein FtsW